MVIHEGKTLLWILFQFLLPNLDTLEWKSSLRDPYENKSRYLFHKLSYKIKIIYVTFLVLIFCWLSIQKSFVQCTYLWIFFFSPSLVFRSQLLFYVHPSTVDNLWKVMLRLDTNSNIRYPWRLHNVSLFFYPDIFESEAFSFRIRLLSTRLRADKLNPAIVRVRISDQKLVPPPVYYQGFLQ